MQRVRSWAWLPIACGLVVGATHASAVEIWSVSGGRTTIHFNTDLLQDLGLELTSVNETTTEAADLIFMETPHWHFRITGMTDFRYEIANGAYAAGAVLDGAIRHEGGFQLRDNATGRVLGARDFQILFTTETGESGERDLLLLGEAGRPAAFELRFGKTLHRGADHGLHVFGFDIDLTADWASQIGRPELAGQPIGIGEIVASVDLTGGELGPGVLTPDTNGGFLDVSLGVLSNMTYVSRTGTYPNGVNALSMATTSCNLGDVDVPWLAPMEEDHPGIAMALYRELDGRFEQIGISDMKHGFFALSNDDCTPCLHPSGGQFLGVGCSDTYGSSNNSDRQWLAPRDEWRAFPGTWECTGSHFADYQPDCVRRHGSSGHGATDHRLVAQDAELANSGATYYYEAYYLVRGDQNKINNVGSRRCTMTWNGSSWSFSTPSSGNPLVEGPALLRWPADRQEWVDVPGVDGDVLLCSKATDIGGGLWQYEYALFNFDSDRMVSRFSVPQGDVTSVESMGFRDSDYNAGNDWTLTVEDGWITWTTNVGAAGGNPLSFGKQFNFRFVGDAPAVDGNVEMETWTAEPMTDAFPGGAVVPEFTPTSVDEPGATASLNLRNQPNPLSGSTTISFDLAQSEPISLDVFDAAGRKVQSLVHSPLPAGSYSYVWDGQNAERVPVGSGVYYYRLQTGQTTAVRSMLVIR